MKQTEITAQNLQMSETLGILYKLAKTVPVNPNSKDEISTAFTTCGLELIFALDDGRIHFDMDEDAAMFYGLLATIMNIAMDGKLRDSFKQATVN